MPPPAEPDARAPSRWMRGAALLCAATVVFTASRDLLLPAIGDVEVWFGLELRGAAARLSAPLHWALFAFGAWAFWREKRWIVPAAAAYLFYVALSHLVWSGTSPNGFGWLSGLLQAALLSLPAALLWRAHRAGRAREGGPAG